MMIKNPTGQPFKRIQCPDDFLPTGIINSKNRTTGEETCVSYTAHNLSVTNMILSSERKADSKLESILPLRGTLKLPFVGTFPVEFEPKIIDTGVVGGTVGNEERLIMEVRFVRPSTLTRALTKYFVNVSENVNEQELKSAGFNVDDKQTQCVFLRTDEQIKVMSKDKIIAEIKISFNSDTLRVHYLKMEKGFDVRDVIMDITAYFIKAAIKAKKRYVSLPSPPDIRLGEVDIYASALGRIVDFKSWKKLFSQWTNYVLTEKLIKPTITDKLRLFAYKAISF